MIWIDAESHLLPPDCCQADFYPAPRELKLRELVYDHPEKAQALAKADAESLLQEMDQLGITKAIIMGLPWADVDRCWQNNDYIAACVSRYPDRFIGFGILPDPHLENPKNAVRKIAEEYHFSGIKVIPSWHGCRLNDPLLKEALSEICQKRLILMPHTDHAYVNPEKADTVFSLVETIKQHPELKILAPHLGGLACLYKLHPPLNNRFRNILFISSVPTSMAMVRFAIAAVGPEKIAFGTDYPFNPGHSQKQVRDAIKSLELPPAQLEAIAGKNIMRFLNLQPSD